MILWAFFLSAVFYLQTNRQNKNTTPQEARFKRHPLHQTGRQKTRQSGQLIAVKVA
jgi:hypothetical protein